MSCNVENRTIFCRDNLDILKNINSKSIDLIYLDPPFNKKKIFTAPIGSASEGAEFSDIFKQEDVKNEWVISILEDNAALYELLEFSKKSEGRTSYNYCYLAYMAVRALEIHRILKDTGSVYLHCDPTMSHYLKLMLDCVFGENNFRSDIAWCYRGMGNKQAKKFQARHDIMLFYSKRNPTFNPQFGEPTAGSKKTYTSAKRVGYLANHSRMLVTIFDETKYKEAVESGKIPTGMRETYFTGGKPLVSDWWADIKILGGPKNKERTGYPTQKPLALLHRIIKASSNVGDIVLDPFCGCATTCVAAEQLNRKWIGIDVSQKAYDLVKSRLKKEALSDPHGDLINQKDINWDKLIQFSATPPKRSDRGTDTREKKYVYIISHRKYKGEYKVGIAKDKEARLSSFQTSDPDRDYKMEHFVLTAHFRELEKHIHNKFPNKHEWVEASVPKIKAEMKSYLAKNP